MEIGLTKEAIKAWACIKNSISALIFTRANVNELLIILHGICDTLATKNVIPS